MDVDVDSIQVERYIAQQIMKKRIVHCFRDSNELVMYNSGFFHPNMIAETEIRELIDFGAKKINIFHGNLKTPISKPYIINPSARNTIFEMIRANSFCNRIDFVPPHTCIFCKNGIYHTDLKKFHSYDLYKHDPYKTTYQLPVEYDPQASTDIWDNFIFDIVKKNKAELIYEMIAYFLMPHIKYQKAFVLHGPPSSGRTTLIDAVIKFLGGEYWYLYISNVKLQDLEEKFALAELRDKILNFFDDLEGDEIVSSEKFRITVTNKHLRAPMKHVQDWISWWNRIKHLFSCNNLPALKRDPGVQFWRRWILISCFSEFKDKTLMTQKDYDDPAIFEKDPNMYEKLTTPEALSGLLNRVIQGWHYLEKHKHFPKKWDDVDYISGLWLMDINPVKLFVDQCCIKDVNGEVDYEVFYAHLNIFRESKNAEKITRNMMTRSLKMLTIPNFNENKKIDKKYHPQSCGRNYVGLTLKDSAIIDLDKNQTKLYSQFEKENEI